ncbi:MAG: glucose-1-phosphate adenylyltransferase [bacterium]|nr:glucose-1-phosphate adenylyltransferase [bacterium]
MERVLVMILAGGKAESLLTLSRVRAKPAVPFGGGFRIIDFVLSNCVNSGLTDINILAQYFPESLKSHIGIGRPWDLDRRTGGVTILEPYQGWEARWYRGTADALNQNIEVIDPERYDLTLVLAGEHVYKMDYRPLINYHRSAGAKLTVAVKQIEDADTSRYGIVELGPGGVITGFAEKQPDAGGNLVNLGIYVFDTGYLLRKLGQLRAEEKDELVNDLIVPGWREENYYSYVHRGYWETANSVEEFYRANLGLLGESALDLNDEEWPVYTKVPDAPPVKFGPQAEVSNSIIADGAIVNGRVADSIVYPWTYIEEGAAVSGSIVMHGSTITGGASVDRAILDKSVKVEADARVGFGDEARPNDDFPEQLDCGLSIIGKRAVVPAGFEVGRNCLIDIGVGAARYEGMDGVLPSGGSMLEGE